MVVLTFNRAKSVISVLLFASCCSAFSSTAFLYPGHLMGSKNKIKRESMNIRWATREAIQMPTSTPMVPYKPPGADYSQFIDIFSRLYRDRIMFISRFIDESAANEIIATILYLREEDASAPLTIYFNVPGAVLRPGLAVYDLLLRTREDCQINTVNLGLCTGMGALLCGAGTKGQRCAMPNSRFLLQRIGMDQPFQGQATDIGLEVSNMKLMNDKLEKELARITGQTPEKCRQDMKRDFYLSSEEAVQYGLIDKVLLASPLKRATQGQDADLGAFEGEGEDQRYQNQKGSGFGGKDKQNGRKSDDDDYEPPASKG